MFPFDLAGGILVATGAVVLIGGVDAYFIGRSSPTAIIDRASGFSVETAGPQVFRAPDGNTVLGLRVGGSL